MSASSTLSLISLLYLLSFVRSELRCYTCNTNELGGCRDPETDAKSTICEPTSNTDRSLFKTQVADIDKTNIIPRQQGNELYQCYSLYFKGEDSNQTGVYRACQPLNSEITSVCAYLTETVTGGNITDCVACNTNHCNTHKLTGDSSTMASSVVVLVVNLIISVYVFQFN